MDSNVITWIDGHVYDNETIPKGMQSYFSDTPNTRRKLNYVGVYLYKNILNVMLPKNVFESYQPNNQDINSLVRAVELNNNLVDNAVDKGYTKEESDLFIVVKWLILDFQRYGLWKQEETEYNKHRGKIDWNLSIKQKRPLIVDNDLVLFDFIKHKFNSVFDDISLIHSNIMEDISARFGLLFNSFSYANRGVSIDIASDKVQHKIVNIFNKQKKHTYARRQKQLLEHIEFYLNLISSGTSGLSVATTEFHIIFEQLVNNYIGSNNLQEYMPKAIWNVQFTDDTPQHHPSNNQYPDGFVIRSDTYVDIYDSKYYDLSNYIGRRVQNQNAPLDWYSVGKQFFYQIAFDYRSSGLFQGTNNFVFPMMTNVDKPLELRDAGYVKINLPSNKQELTILVKTIDPIKLLHY